MRKTWAAWTDLTHLSQLSVAGDSEWIMWTWEDPSLTFWNPRIKLKANLFNALETTLEESRFLDVGGGRLHMLTSGRKGEACLFAWKQDQESEERFFEVLYLILTKIPYQYKEGNSLQNLKNQNYGMAVCSEWACKLFTCFKQTFCDQNVLA